MIARTSRVFSYSAAMVLLLASAFAQASTITGTVTNKTTNRPSAGDTVSLIDVQAGMAEAASTTTNAAGEYSIDTPGMKPYLIRVSHQGGTYFIAAPQGGGPGDVTVYDVAAKVSGVSIDADMMLIEAGGGMLRVQERYLVRNTSLPPKAQFSNNTFEIAIPTDAELDGASATRPGGLSTNTHLAALGEKGHYTFNVPIQPNKGEKETLFEVQYHISYSGKYKFTPHLQMPADNLVIYVAKGIEFTAAQGSNFQSTQEDPRVQTFVAKNVHPGQSIGFTVSGEGQMPRDTQGAAMGQQAGMGEAGTGDIGNRPGGGIGAPIGSPDPLTKYKWWILGFLALLLAGTAAFFLRARGQAIAGNPGPVKDVAFESSVLPGASHPVTHTFTPDPAQTVGNAVLLNILKEELFAIESEKLSGTLSPDEYAMVKTGLEALLKRALKKG